MTTFPEEVRVGAELDQVFLIIAFVVIGILALIVYVIGRNQHIHQAQKSRKDALAKAVAEPLVVALRGDHTNTVERAKAVVEAYDGQFKATSALAKALSDCVRPLEAAANCETKITLEGPAMMAGAGTTTLINIAVQQVDSANINPYAGAAVTALGVPKIERGITQDQLNKVWLALQAFASVWKSPLLLGAAFDRMHQALLSATPFSRPPLDLEALKKMTKGKP